MHHLVSFCDFSIDTALAFRPYSLYARPRRASTCPTRAQPAQSIFSIIPIAVATLVDSSPHQEGALELIASSMIIRLIFHHLLKHSLKEQQSPN
jgi:hypothetical protein